ncbi:hypothetical protein CEXT_71021 [Caerostris extrusa]|uniref:Uncharacterized protein n=1 Tax=Caerostris extrusa TaxID=172846 RepID=A0AAV4MV43_CAEEX|nr:hypothetical protein CEXT_71021 [Caerostris extrusa]
MTYLFNPKVPEIASAAVLAFPGSLSRSISNRVENICPPPDRLNQLPPCYWGKSFGGRKDEWQNIFPASVKLKNKIDTLDFTTLLNITLNVSYSFFWGADG